MTLLLLLLGLHSLAEQQQLLAPSTFPGMLHHWRNVQGPLLLTTCGAVLHGNHPQTAAAAAAWAVVALPPAS
jgi:hypothetical protein